MLSEWLARISEGLRHVQQGDESVPNVLKREKADIDGVMRRDSLDLDRMRQDMPQPPRRQQDVECQCMSGCCKQPA